MFMCLCVTKVLSGVDQTNQGFTSCKIGLFLVKEGVFLSIKENENASSWCALEKKAWFERECACDDTLFNC